jgi:hypothetical protein
MDTNQAAALLRVGEYENATSRLARASSMPNNARPAKAGVRVPAFLFQAFAPCSTIAIWELLEFQL